MCGLARGGAKQPHFQWQDRSLVCERRIARVFSKCVCAALPLSLSFSLPAHCGPAPLSDRWLGTRLAWGGGDPKSWKRGTWGGLSGQTLISITTWPASRTPPFRPRGCHQAVCCCPPPREISAIARPTVLIVLEVCTDAQVVDSPHHLASALLIHTSRPTADMNFSFRRLWRLMALFHPQHTPSDARDIQSPRQSTPRQVYPRVHMSTDGQAW